METKKIVIGLGESITLKLADAIGDDTKAKEIFKDGPGKWGSTGSAAVISSEDLNSDSVIVVGSSLGKVLIFNRRDVDMNAQNAVAAKIAGADFLRNLEDSHAVAFEVEVVKDSPSKVAPVASPLADSHVYEGLLPMNEMQDGPSEKSPYGLDQEGKPIAPHPGMVGPDTSSVARQSEDAVATNAPAGTVAPVPDSEKEGSKSSSKKAGKTKASSKGKASGAAKKTSGSKKAASKKGSKSPQK